MLDNAAIWLEDAPKIPLDLSHDILERFLPDGALCNRLLGHVAGVSKVEVMGLIVARGKHFPQLDASKRVSLIM